MEYLWKEKKRSIRVVSKVYFEKRYRVKSELLIPIFVVVFLVNFLHLHLILTFGKTSIKVLQREACPISVDHLIKQDKLVESLQFMDRLECMIVSISCFQALVPIYMISHRICIMIILNQCFLTKLADLTTTMQYICDFTAQYQCLRDLNLHKMANIQKISVCYIH